MKLKYSLTAAYNAQTSRFSPDLLGVRQAGGVGEGGVPELCDRRPQVLLLVRKHHTEQRRQQSQQLIVEGQTGARLQAAENVAEELLKLQEDDRNRLNAAHSNLENLRTRL